MPVTTQTVEIKSPREIETMREAGTVVAAALELLRQAASAGVATAELDRIAASEIRKRKAKPAFLNYRGFPSTLCSSVNEEVVHGIPREDKVLREGDIIGLDLGCVLRGYYADAAITVAVGKASLQARDLIETTRQALEQGIGQMWPERRIGDISHAIESAVELKGYSVVRAFVGHGIGRALHEFPAVPNYGKPGAGLRLAVGMVLAVEPMVNVGGAEVRVLEDGWTAVTVDGGLSAHFEHTIAVTENGPRVLTVS